MSAERAQRKKERPAEPRGPTMSEYLPEVTNNCVSPEDAEEELLKECESIWKHMEKHQSKLLLLGTEAMLESDVKLCMLMMRVKALMAEYHQWQNRSPDLISTNPDVLLELGKEELQKVKNDLEMVLSIVQLKNKKLEEDLKREQQWHKEQELILDTLTGIEEETKIKIQQLPKTSLTARAFQELQNKVSKLRMYKEELLDALGEFLEEHFPLPESDGSAKKENSSEEPDVELITLNEILEILIGKLMNTPHEPYVTIDDSFWPPYIELLLRYGIALRHPEDPNRMRLEAFHM
ncbi:PREDICTED: centromere protein K [Calidris pugnax]|uniref:centromere protein K n=1 Tax=Calidris pugnax TaxID=198806 RepID=UPI00071D02E0|nr:PREDICTED: centromere protein K [Calidris pugnax]